MIFQPKPQRFIVLLLLWKQPIDLHQILVETPKFWPLSKCTDPPINVADKLGNKTKKTETLVRYLIT